MNLDNFYKICGFLYSVCNRIEEGVITNNDIEQICEVRDLLQSESRTGGKALISDCRELVSSYNLQIQKRSLQERINCYNSYLSIHERIKVILIHLERGKWDYRAKTRKSIMEGLEGVYKPCESLHKKCQEAFEYNPYEAKTLEQLIRRLGKEKALEQAEKFRGAGYLDEDYFPTEEVTDQQMGLMGQSLAILCGCTQKQISEIWGKPNKFIDNQVNKAKSAVSNPKNQAICELMK